ncbi:MAG: RNA methyltransferase [Chitinophagaceae bacterium]|nr:RNA methyltransferase [Oligoflexus sp.]
MIDISSPQNPKIKELVALRESRERRKQDVFVVEGAREIERALKAGYTCRTLYVEENLLSDASHDLVKRIPASSQYSVSKEAYAKAAVREGSDGVLAVMDIKAHTFADIKPRGKPLLLVLENLEKPGNFGALARSADGVGVDAIVILDPKADLYNPHAIRASVGALFSQPLIATSHDEFFAYCKGQAITIVAASPHAAKFHYQADLKGPVALVLGSEAWGLSGAWKSSELVKIPMNGLADSLNVSVAGAVIMYEALRQRS